jgi:hypothetical protein
MLHFSLPNTIQYNRAELKIKAEAEARKTYVFKKPSGSRSIHVQQENGPKPKRSKTSSNEQKEQVSSVSIQLELIKNQISSKQQLSSKASTVKDFALCSKVQGEMRKLCQEKANHEKMLKMLQTKERNSNSLPPTESSSSLTVDIRSLFTRQQASNTSSVLLWLKNSFMMTRKLIFTLTYIWQRRRRLKRTFPPTIILMKM